MTNARQCLQTLGFDSTLAVIPTWAALRRAYLRKVRSSHPDSGMCNANEFIRVQAAYKQLCAACTPGTPGTPVECDSDDEHQSDQASTRHVQTVRLPLKHKSAQFAGQRFHLTGLFRVNGDASECGTRGQTLVRKFIQNHEGKVLKTFNYRVSCVVAGCDAHAATLRTAQRHGTPVVGIGLLVTAIEVGFQQALGWV
jgi:hypothetical protein